MLVAASVIVLMQLTCLAISSVEHITFKTPQIPRSDDGWYSYTGLNTFGYSMENTTSLTFGVQACSGAQVALMAGNSDDSLLYEIVISGWNNSKYVLRTQKQGRAVLTGDGGMLNCAESKLFEVKWGDGSITLHRKCHRGKWLPVFRWEHSEPDMVRNIGFTTGFWASGTWTYQQPNIQGTTIEFETPKQTGKKYNYKHLEDFGYSVDQSTSVRFSVQACSDAHVALKSEKWKKCKMYEIVIGGYDNKLSVIRRGQNRFNVRAVPSSPLDCSSYKPFIVSWAEGMVSVWTETSTNVWQPLVTWRDRHPLVVKYVGMTTGTLSSGKWKVEY